MPLAQHPKQYLFQQLGTSVWGSLEEDRECRWSHLRQGDSFDGATGKRSGMLMGSLAPPLGTLFPIGKSDPGFHPKHFFKLFQ